MKLKVNKGDLLSMVKGAAPAYSIMDDPLISRVGYFIGGHVEKWCWNSELEDLSEVELLEVYNKCKESWK